MKNTPRDFFLHLGAFGALYLAATALITLLFQLINYTFPDPLYAPYYSGYDPYAGILRFAIASLIILVPLFLYLMRVIQAAARREPERHSLGIRRWLTYITLFVAGATITGDLITLLYSFLGGELATPFLCKILVLLAIMGINFWYFILDIRGYWQARERESKMVGWSALVFTVAVIILGFYIMGSPFAQREIRFDQQEIQDLNNIQNQIVNYWQQNGRLPTTLSQIESDLTYATVPIAPEGREAYEYRSINDLSFSLCATFGVASDEYGYSEPSTYGLQGKSSWDHNVGRTCFTRMIDPALIQPMTKPRPQ
jgi:hypothetical protein